ncbi:MAG: hypothetical protein ACLR2M_07420 [Varibaculum sp.]
MLNLNTWNLFTLPLNGGVAETAPDDLRLLAAVGDEARNDYLRGVSAIGNLIFWACDNPSIRALTPALAFLKHTADMALPNSWQDLDHGWQRGGNNATQTSLIKNLIKLMERQKGIGRDDIQIADNRPHSCRTAERNHATNRHPPYATQAPRHPSKKNV